MASIPVYFGTMAAEHRYLKNRAAEFGPTPGDYTPPDTAASLAMGVGSLLAPIVMPKLVRNVVPGKGKYAKYLLGAAAAAAVATSLADRMVDATPDADDAIPPGKRRLGRIARRARKVTAPTAMAAGTLALSTFFASRTNPDTMWEKGKQRDRGQGPMAWAAAIAGWDFIYYWNHRFMHEVRGHVGDPRRAPLERALQPLHCPAPAGGRRAGCLGAVRTHGPGRGPSVPDLPGRAINLLYQYWIHTETIRTLGPAEQVLNTASHHRVHHGSNPQYLDRNHGSILIVWDKLFGTFEPEDEPVVYGLTKNIDTFNPAVIASHEYRDIVRDVAGRRTGTIACRSCCAARAGRTSATASSLPPATRSSATRPRPSPPRDQAAVMPLASSASVVRTRPSSISSAARWNSNVRALDFGISIRTSGG